MDIGNIKNVERSSFESLFSIAYILKRFQSEDKYLFDDFLVWTSKFLAFPNVKRTKKHFSKMGWEDWKPIFNE